jgi:hypothetical protein
MWYRYFALEVFGTAAGGFFQAQNDVGGVGRVDGMVVGSLEKVVSFQGR